jgi:hypothetical protein
MKSLIALAFIAISLPAMAKSPAEAVAQVEADRNVRCEYVKSSSQFCFGMPREVAVCRSTQTYKCEGGESLFTLKLKVKSYYSTRTHSRETVVTKIEI